MILLCYDGSTDAQSAIDHAGELLSGQPVTVLTVWEPFIAMITRTGTGLGLGAAPFNVEEIDAASERAAQERAEEGAERARQAGLNALLQHADRTVIVVPSPEVAAERAAHRHR